MQAETSHGKLARVKKDIHDLIALTETDAKAAFAGDNCKAGNDELRRLRLLRRALDLLNLCEK